MHFALELFFQVDIDKLYFASLGSWFIITFQEALHLSGAGAPDRLQTRMRTRNSAVRVLSPVLLLRVVFVARSA